MKQLTAHELMKKARMVEVELGRLQTGRTLLSPTEVFRATQLKKQRLWVKDQLDSLTRIARGSEKRVVA